MNIVKIEIIINAIVAVATVLALIVIWKTLREMKIQRHKIFEPQIFPMMFKVYILCNYPVEIFPVKWALKKENLIISETADKFLELRNIGQGIANKIVVEVFWNVKYQEYFNKLKTEFKQCDSDINITVSDASCQIYVRKNNKNVYGSNFPFDLKTQHLYDYLLPVRENNESIKIPIPRSIELMISLTLILYELYNALSYSKKYVIVKRLIDYLDIGINIQFKDNLDKFYSRHFKLGLSMPMVEFNSKYHGKIYTIHLESVRSH